MKSTLQIIAENPRMGWAVFGSMLLHASIVAPWSVARLEAPPARPAEIAGFAASLVARIAGAKVEEGSGEPARAPAPRIASRPPVVVERPAVEYAVPFEEDSAAESETIAFSTDAGEGQGDADGYRGVSVRETLFLRPLPPAFKKILSEFPGHFQATQINRPPQPVNIVMPRYPARELGARAYTWIVMALFIDEHGKVIAAVPVTGSEGYEDFQDQVAAALRESTFTGGERFGLPVRTVMYQMVEFRPPETADSATPVDSLPVLAP